MIGREQAESVRPHERLKADILASYKSVHAFCKDHREFCRGTVYMLVSGKYPGDFERQAARIRASLRDCEQNERSVLPLALDPDKMRDILQETRCQNCRRLNRRECMACRDQTAREAVELARRLREI